ncbi:MAG: polysaccharide biosynthesis protein [Clostridia bacterium]|nr:polysaccharide biosynthesis protein [Clostridia bacterium]
MQYEKSKSFVKSALLLSLGGLTAKLLGAFYRIPLTNIIGSYGMGLYQLVFPPYILVLTLACFGMQSSISKLTAENLQLGNKEKTKSLFFAGLKIMCATGVLGTLILTVFSNVIAKAQGNVDTTVYFCAVAPSVLFVAMQVAFKGYFQGRLQMMPSALTTVIEQMIKLVTGLGSAYLFMPDVHMAVLGMVLGISISEFTSLAILIVWYFATKEKILLRRARWQTREYKELFMLALPVAAGGFVMQLGQVIDSAMVVNLVTVGNATSLYGLWSGPVNSMLGLPVSLASGIAITALPKMSKDNVSSQSQSNKTFSLAVGLSVAIALPCAIGLIILAKPILSLLYGGLTSQEIEISAHLLSLSGLAVLFQVVLVTLVSVLQAYSKPYVSTSILAFGVVVKAVVNLVLLPNPQINIYGSAISETICYLFQCVFAIIYTTTKLKLKGDFTECLLKPLVCTLAMTLVITAFCLFKSDFVGSNLGTVLLVGVSAVVYFGLLIVWGKKLHPVKELSNEPTV